MPIKPALWNMAIPTFGQQLLINQVMRGEPVSLVYAVFSALVTFAVGLALLLIAIRLYQREAIVFGR
jgi:sodium transport system permease protein